MRLCGCIDGSWGGMIDALRLGKMVLAILCVRGVQLVCLLMKKQKGEIFSGRGIHHLYLLTF
jgi:hypothetical protein